VNRATVRTDHGSPTVAERVAGAVRPDNTAEMVTRVDDATVVTTIEREATGGLHATVDDYVVNLTVATALADDTTPARIDTTTDSDTTHQ
jgi:hypothetical protein